MIDVGRFISTPLKGPLYLQHQTGCVVSVVQSLACLWPSYSGSMGQECLYSVAGPLVVMLVAGIPHLCLLLPQ